MDYDAQVRAHAVLLAEQIRGLATNLNTALKGKRCRIVSAFNDQPYGRSKKPLTGKVFTIKRAFTDRDPWVASSGKKLSGITLWLEGCDNGIDFVDVEIVDE